MSDLATTKDKQGGSLGKQAAQGAVWNYGTFLLSKGLLFVATLILARLLTPDQFGLVGMALLVINILDILRDFGIGASVIYYGKEGPAAANMAFAFSSVMGLVLFAANWLLAPITVHFFKTASAADTTTVTQLIQVLGLSLLFASVGSTHDAILQKEINYRRRMIPEVGRTLLKGAMQVVFAFAGFGVWSLVWGQVIGEGCATLLLWFVSGWRPALAFRRDLFRPMFKYSFHSMLAGGLGTLLSDVDYFIIGAMLGEASLGIYTLAFRIPEMLITNLSNAVSTVAFPVAVKLKADIAAMRDAYIRMQHYMLVILAPLGFGLFAVTPGIVHLLFKAEWEPVIPVMQILSVYMVLGGISHWPGVVYKAVGRPDMMNITAVIKLAMLVPGLWYGASVGGILGVAWAQLFLRVAGNLVDMAFVARFAQMSVPANLRALWPPLAAATLMAVSVRLLYMALDPVERSVAVLVLAVLVGGAVYAAAIWLIDRPAVIALFGLGRSMIRRNRLAQA